ncbi:MAG: LD-carboxypeptidase [Desulfobacteraceae bacterium]|nr:LD-carboxypeptidase [Desulfobacteraceae bacterium]
MMKNFYPLEKGDTIGVAAPCACFDDKRLNLGIDCLKTLGFHVHVPRGIFGKKRYLAGDDSSRAAVINELFADPGIKGIIAARGGFGAMRMLENLDWEMIRKNPKLVIGFSDVTALLTAIIQQTQFAAVHGPNLVSLASASPGTISSFYRAITDIPADIKIDDALCLFPGQAQGKLVGGNMATLTHLIGTPFQPNFDGGILFLEDVGEPAYKIDRMLSQMKMAGMLMGIKGVITGSFDNCENWEYIPQILSEIFDGVPLVMGLCAGHGDLNLSLPMGLDVVLDTARAQLKWQVTQ